MTAIMFVWAKPRSDRQDDAAKAPEPRGRHRVRGFVTRNCSVPLPARQPRSNRNAPVSP